MTTYQEYYTACRAAYSGPPSTADVYRLGVHVTSPGTRVGGEVLTLDADHQADVTALAREVQRRVDGSIGIFGNRDPQVRDLSVQLDDFWDLGALGSIAERFLPQVEDRVLGCHAVINQVNLIRSLPGATTPATSWLWHYDNCPDESFKILVYLTDVAADGGAFEYLRAADGSVVKVPSSRISPQQKGPPRWPQSRVPPEAIDELGRGGFTPYRAVGPAGTSILFDNNCVHRATTPRRQHRDALILNFRPSHRAVRPCIAREHTGSWSFNVKQWVPEELEIGEPA
jgi:hypothetical protein